MQQVIGIEHASQKWANLRPRLLSLPQIVGLTTRLCTVRLTVRLDPCSTAGAPRQPLGVLDFAGGRVSDHGTAAGVARVVEPERLRPQWGHARGGALPVSTLHMFPSVSNRHASSRRQGV